MATQDDSEEEETLTKAKIVDAVYGRIEGTKKEAADYVENVIETIKDTTEEGDEVKISGFGKFVVRHKESQVGRNPKTMVEYEIPERKVLRFKLSPVFKDELNGDRDFDGF